MSWVSIEQTKDASADVALLELFVVLCLAFTPHVLLFSQILNQIFTGGLDYSRASCKCDSGV